MAKLSDFRADTNAINDGVWTRVSEANYGDLEILSRGFTDEFIDSQNAMMMKAAAKHAPPGTPLTDRQSYIPNSVMRTINAELLRRHLVLDVRNLLDDAGNAVPVAKFHEMLGDMKYGRLARACWEAAGSVSLRSAEELETAMGNLPGDSGSNSTGGNSGHG